MRGGESVKCIWGFSDAVISRMGEGWRKMKRMRGELLEKPKCSRGWFMKAFAWVKARIWNFKRVSAPIKSFWAVWLDGVRLKQGFVTLYLYYLGEHCQSGGTSVPFTHPDPMGLTQQAVQSRWVRNKPSSNCLDLPVSTLLNLRRNQKAWDTANRPGPHQPHPLTGLEWMPLRSMQKEYERV